MLRQYLRGDSLGRKYKSRYTPYASGLCCWCHQPSRREYALLIFEPGTPVGYGKGFMGGADAIHATEYSRSPTYCRYHGLEYSRYESRPFPRWDVTSSLRCLSSVHRQPHHPLFGTAVPLPPSRNDDLVRPGSLSRVGRLGLLKSPPLPPPLFEFFHTR